MLGGRCRRCHGAVSKRYPFVELVSGLLWLLSWNIYGASFRFIVAVVFLSLLLIAVFTDFETALIPDSVTFFGMFMGLAMSFLIPPLDFPFFKWSSFGESFFGLFVGGSLIFGSGVIGKRVFKKETIGGGDIKLLAMIGSFLGWRKVLLTFFMAPFLALPFAFLYRWIKKQETIPYGSFLSLAAAVQFFYGETIWVYFIES
jgi:leader peptidase (prepilin peptidase)/N-methyltransferase